MNILTADVMNGIIGASSSRKMADVSMNVYRQAETKGDEETMERAMGYTTDSLNSANDYSQKTQKALEEAQTEASEQDRIEQQEALAKNVQDSVQAPDVQQPTALNVNGQGTIQPKQHNSDNLPPTDTVEISNEGKAALQNAAQDTAIYIPVTAGNAPITEARIYTSKGAFKPEAGKVRLSTTG